MMYAMVGDKKMRAMTGVKGFCQCCDSKVISKCGRINIWHWAHEVDSDCPGSTEPMTQWHLEWQMLVSEENREVILEKDGKRMIADIRKRDGSYLEVQHSPISSQMIKNRCDFYEKVDWIFDVREKSLDDRFAFYKYDNYYSFKWKWASKSQIACLTDGSRLFWDLGDGEMFHVKKLCEKGTGWGQPIRKEKYINDRL